MPEKLDFGALWPVPPGRFGWTARGNAPCLMEIVSWLTTGAIDTAWPGVSPAIAEYVQAAQMPSTTLDGRSCWCWCRGSSAAPVKTIRPSLNPQGAFYWPGSRSRDWFAARPSSWRLVRAGRSGVRIVQHVRANASSPARGRRICETKSAGHEGDQPRPQGAGHCGSRETLPAGTTARSSR